MTERTRRDARRMWWMTALLYTEQVRGSNPLLPTNRGIPPRKSPTPEPSEVPDPDADELEHAQEEAAVEEPLRLNDISLN